MSASVRDLNPRLINHPESEYVRWFNQISMDDVSDVGGKNASLGEMVRELTPLGVRIPNGFATTAKAYTRFLAEGGLDQKIAKILSAMKVEDVESLHSQSAFDFDLLFCKSAIRSVLNSGHERNTVRLFIAPAT